MTKSSRNSIAALTILPIALTIPAAAVYQAISSGEWATVIASFMLTALGGLTVGSLLFLTLSLSVHEDEPAGASYEQPRGNVTAIPQGSAHARAA